MQRQRENWKRNGENRVNWGEGLAERNDYAAHEKSMRLDSNPRWVMVEMEKYRKGKMCREKRAKALPILVFLFLRNIGS